MCAYLLLGGALVLALLTGPVMASDGELSFWSDRDGNWKIYFMSPDGSDVVEARELASRLREYDVRDLAWSADGGRIAFTSRRDGNPEIHVSG